MCDTKCPLHCDGWEYDPCPRRGGIVDGRFAEKLADLGVMSQPNRVAASSVGCPPSGSSKFSQEELPNLHLSIGPFLNEAIDPLRDGTSDKVGRHMTSIVNGE